MSSASSQSSSSCRACRAVLFDKLDTAKMHGLDTSNVSSRVESRRDELSGILAVVKHTVEVFNELFLSQTRKHTVHIKAGV